MADPELPAVPQAFTFGGYRLVGLFTGYRGRRPRRKAVHEYLKRRAGRVEDQERGSRTLGSTLVFTGDDCAKQYADFVEFIERNPTALLVHPTLGRFNAFCDGPAEDVNLVAVDQIMVQVEWTETIVDGFEPEETQTTPAAAQAVTAQLGVFEQATAAYMGAVAMAQGMKDAAVAQVQSVVASVADLADPIASMRETISTTVGTTSAAVGAVVSIQTQAQLLSQDVTNLVASAGDTFNPDVTPPTIDAVELLLGAVVARSALAEEAMAAAASTPAGAGEVVAQTEELVSDCYELVEAIRQSKPPVVNYTVPRRIDLISLCVQLFPGSDAYARASTLLSMNRIKNPAAIAAGTILRVPSR